MAIYKRNYAQAFGKAARSALSTWNKINYNQNKRQKTTFKKKTTAGVGITAQHDAVVTYKKRYMPRRKKRSWKKFSKKVKAVQLSSLAKRTFVLNDREDNTNDANQQTWNFYMIYGKNGDPVGTSSSYGIRDLRQISDSFAGSGTNTVNDNQKLQFMSAVLDITFQLDPTATNVVELDVYHIQFNKAPADTRPALSLSKAQSATPTSTLGASLEMEDRGATLFDFPLFLSATGCKILKKTKYFLAQGQCITYQIRDPKNRQISRMEITDYNSQIDSTTSGITSYVKAGWTQGVFYTVKPGPVQPTATCKLSVGVTRKYLVSQIDSSSYQDYN